MSGNEFMEKVYNLQTSPFISKAVTDKGELKFWVDRKKEQEKWEYVMSNSKEAQKNSMVFIVASYGRGKTLSLLKIVKKAEEDSGIFSEFLNFKSEERTKSGLDFMFRIFKYFDFNLLKQKGTDKIEQALNQIPNDFQEPRAILQRILSSDDQQARHFISGELRPNKTEREQLGILRRIETVEVAKEYLAALLFLLKKLEYHTLLLAVDEFEYLFSVVTRSQRSIDIALLRGLYDFPLGLKIGKSEVANLLFYIAVSDDGYNSLKEMENAEKATGGPTTPLFDRIDATITLGDLDEAATKELVSRRLSYSRKDKKINTKPLIPFTDDFVSFIYQKKEGNPRFTIQLCDHILDAGLAQRVQILDKDFASKFIEERHLI